MRKQRLSALLMLAIAGFMSTGCSTPAVPEYDGETLAEEALSSYETCRDRLYPVSRSYQCDSVTPVSSYGLSYNDYTYGNTNYFKAELSSVADQKALDTSWKAYLSTLNEEALQEMAKQWDELK